MFEEPDFTRLSLKVSCWTRFDKYYISRPNLVDLISCDFFRRFVLKIFDCHVLDLDLRSYMCDGAYLTELICWRTFISTSKNKKGKKTRCEKISYISGNRIFEPQALDTLTVFSIFFFLYFNRQPTKPKNQKFLVFRQKKFSPYFRVTADQAIK